MDNASILFPPPPFFSPFLLRFSLPRFSFSAISFVFIAATFSIVIYLSTHCARLVVNHV